MKMKTRMKKIVLMMFTGLILFGFTAPIQGQDYEKYRDRTRPSDSYKYRNSGYRDYSSHQRYYPHGQQYHYKYYYKSERRILKEIRKNERRILKLQHKIRKYSSRGYYRGYYRYGYSTMRIRHLQMEIRRLEQRNRYLRRLLYR
jgi:hypothetical protein